MAKTRDFRPELRHFVKVLNSFRGYYYDYDVFKDFIDYVVACLLWEGDKSLAENLKGKYKDDYQRFNEMFVALVNTMNDMITDDNSWYDALGTLYEEISSRSKSSFLGQFFTPASVCDFMSQINIDGLDYEPKGITVLDPSCGSGRTLLSFHVKAPGNYYVAQDIDDICTKMCAINMAIHGMRGQVINGDTLAYTFRYGYEINPWQNMTGGMPHIIPVHSRDKSNHNIDTWKSFYGRSLLHTNDNNQQVNPVLDKPLIIGKKNQLMLF